MRTNVLPCMCDSNHPCATPGTHVHTTLAPDLSSHTLSTAEINKSDALGTQFNNATSEAGVHGNLSFPSSLIQLLT